MKVFFIFYFFIFLSVNIKFIQINISTKQPLYTASVQGLLESYERA